MYASKLVSNLAYINFNALFSPLLYAFSKLGNPLVVRAICHNNIRMSWFILILVDTFTRFVRNIEMCTKLQIVHANTNTHFIYTNLR